MPCRKRSEHARRVHVQVNSLKFAQNKSFSDCVLAVLPALLQTLELAALPSKAKRVGAVKACLGQWGALLARFVQGAAEQDSHRVRDGPGGQPRQACPSRALLTRHRATQQSAPPPSVLWLCPACALRRQRPLLDVQDALLAALERQCEEDQAARRVADVACGNA